MFWVKHARASYRHCNPSICYSTCSGNSFSPATPDLPAASAVTDLTSDLGVWGRAEWLCHCPPTETSIRQTSPEYATTTPPKSLQLSAGETNTRTPHPGISDKASAWAKNPPPLHTHRNCLKTCLSSHANTHQTN